MKCWIVALMRWTNWAPATCGRRHGGDGHAEDEPPAPGCGWYESSWDLERGLAVVEGPSLEEAVWALVNGGEAPA